MNKKVVILHPAHWEQAMGGAELQIFYLAKELKKKGFEVHFIYEDKGSFIQNSDELQLYPLQKINIRKTFGQRWWLYRKRIFNLLHIIQPDVIYTRFYSSWSGFSANYAEKHNIKHIWAIASDNDVNERKLIDFIRKPLNFVEYFYVKSSFEKATHIITQNKYQRDSILKHYNRNSIHIPKTCNIENNDALIKTYKTVNIVWIANLKNIKRPEIFIELVIFFKDNNQLKFKMIGRMASSYEKLISDTSNFCPNFSFIGEVTNYQIHQLLKNEHILINTSDYEALPNTFIEAWGNKMIVLSRIVNPDEIITQQGIGFICPTVETISEKLLMLSKNTDMLNQMGEKAYSYVLANHSFENNIEKVIALMK